MSIKKSYDALSLKMSKFEEKITFTSDGFLLEGILHMPKKEKPPVVIGSHGLLSSSSSPKQIELARHCNEKGIGYFRFDHRGCGKSNGSFYEVTSLKARCNDLACAIMEIKKRDDTGKQIGLFGSSLGGAACISVADRFDVNAFITYAAPVNSRSIIDAVKKSDDYSNEDLLFYNKNLQFDISEKLSGLHNILIFHGDADEVVDPSHAIEIFNKAAEPKRMIMQKNGDHPMSSKGHQKEFIKEAVEWFKSNFEAF